WQPLDRLQQDLQSSANGLSANEAQLRLRRFGLNVVQAKRKRAVAVEFVARFANPLIVLLIIASGISALTGDSVSFVIIIAMVVMSVTLDFFQEHRAERAAEKLKSLVAAKASVLRDGAATEMPVSQLVPGDIVLLAAGSRVPADGRVLEARDFFVNQALLTGEPYPVEKHPEKGAIDDADPLSARDAVFMGSSVISGSARVFICATGQHTALGAIAGTLAAKPPPTAFEQGTRRFGMLILRITLFLVLFVLLVNALYHRPLLDSFMFALALAVGLTPELLPMVVSVTLSRGALRMAREHVIVKHLPAIHDLGSMDVLCTDKTGTLTEARIRLERHVDTRGRESERVLELAYLNSFFETGLKSPLDEAILAHEKIEVSDWRKVDEAPFDFERRRVSVLVENNTQRLLVVKGAPEDVLRICSRFEEDGPDELRPLDAAALGQIESQFAELGREGFRVLAIAWREVGRHHDHARVGDETELVFAGFAAFLDPPKASAAQAVSALANSGIAVKIVTGDNEHVTRHICEQLGIPATGILTGKQLAGLDDHALQARVETVNLFCRVTPAQKNRVILALKARRHVVGYLGDGINDAPPLHSADVGISVDTAVDVAKDAADMILLKHDLSVLCRGVVEGRRTFANIMKYIMMGTSSNFGNMFSMAGAALFLPFLPMLPIQILLNNLLYDFSEIAIPLDRVDAEELRAPHGWNMQFIRNFMLVLGPVSSIFDFITFYLMQSVLRANEALFQTGWFIESLATQVLVIFVIRTRGNPIKSRPHPWLVASSLAVVALAAALPFTRAGAYFGFVAPPLPFFAILCVLAITYLVVAQIVKRWFYLAQQRGFRGTVAVG
ncbi:MAG TPA: magnesium-translocating P-type ATPase, partial [Burkholderiales bacterium]|nr:magnesium-translocating P-type ATPase [Burkholderiales bacterium]